MTTITQEAALKALRDLERYWPCQHETFELRGFGEKYIKCWDCGAETSLERLPFAASRHAQFGAAVDTLREFIENTK